MSVWVCIPSARPAAEVEVWAKAWRERGYRIALWRDDGLLSRDFESVDSVQGGGQYPGYAVAVNKMIAFQLEYNAEPPEWFVIGGDDVFPDPNHTAEEIAQECYEHFRFRITEPLIEPPLYNRAHEFGTFGVCQPTGDRWGENPNHPNPAMRSAYIDRVCGSAWIGREFARRVNGGRGPLWAEYRHMFVDEHLQRVAEKLGVFWRRPDLTQHHAHAGRVKNYTADMVPEHLKQWNTREHWEEAKAIFKRHEAAGFAESCDLLP
jgi:hypothetical protein